MPNLRASAVRFGVLLCVLAGLQWLSGAYGSESSLEPDEPAHIVSGMAVRQYVTGGLGANPLSFATDYYLHYPKLALGHWPPVFYVEQAAWTLLFPASRDSLLILMALQSALVLSMLWLLLCDRYGSQVAWMMTLAFCTLPSWVHYTSSVMTEVPITLLILLAMRSWGNFLQLGQPGSAIRFGIWSAAALLSKGTGAVLALVPGLSMIFARRHARVFTWSFWAPLAIVITICAPWYLLAPDALHDRVAKFGAVGVVQSRLSSPLIGLAGELGWILTGLALLGILIVLTRRFSENPADPTLATAAALAASAIVFPLFVGAWESRHCLESAPAFVVLAAEGGTWISSRMHKLGAPGALGPALAAAVFLGLVGSNLAALPRQTPLAYSALAESIHAGSTQIILIAGDTVAEGTFIAELAMREPQPRRYVVRATKAFADISWMGTVRTQKVHSPEDVARLLQALSVDMVVIDQRHPAGIEYQAQLHQAVLEDPATWRSLSDPGNDLTVFERKQASVLTSEQIELRLRAVLPAPIR